jgi:hypothetical protein
VVGWALEGEGTRGRLWRVAFAMPRLASLRANELAGPLARAHKSEAPPTDGDEPGSRHRDDGRILAARRRLAPAVEPARRGSRIEVTAGPVLRPILQDVDQRGANLARGAQSMRMVPIRKDGTSHAHGTMNRVRHAVPERLHTAREGTLIVCFDNQMQVVRRHREMHDAKVRPVSQGDGAADRREHELVASQAGEPFAHPQGDMHGMSRLVYWSPPMRDTYSAPGRLSARARSLPAVESRFGK